jgi:hypothetical protein
MEHSVKLAGALAAAAAARWQIPGSIAGFCHFNGGGKRSGSEVKAD